MRRRFLLLLVALACFQTQAQPGLRVDRQLRVRGPSLTVGTFTGQP